MRRVIKKIIRWFTQPDEIYVVLRKDTKTSLGAEVILTSYELLEAVRFVNQLNSMRSPKEEGIAWLTKVKVI